MNDMSPTNLNYVGISDYLLGLQNAVIGMIKWRHVVERVLRKCHSLLTYDWLVAAVLRGEFTFLENGRAFMFIKTEQMPLGSRVLIYAAGGDMDAVVELQEKVEAFAKENGVRQIAAMVRPGFRKWPKQEGWFDTRQLWIMKELQ